MVMFRQCIVQILWVHFASCRLAERKYSLGSKIVDDWQIYLREKNRVDEKCGALGSRQIEAVTKCDLLDAYGSNTCSFVLTSGDFEALLERR
jgi:hypothetical protein